MSYNYLTQFDIPAFSPAKDIRCYNLKVDGNIDFNQGSIDPSNITPGSENQVLKVTGGVLQYVDQLVNSNIPDPLVLNEIDPGDIRDDNGSVGTNGQVLQKIGSNLVWGNLNTPLGDINNFTTFQTTPGAATPVPNNDTPVQFIFNSFYATSSPGSLINWSLSNQNNYFVSLGVYEVVLDINMVYPSGSNGKYTISLVSNVANLNGRIYNRYFNAPGLGSDIVDHFQISFIVDRRVGDDAELQVFVTNHNSSSTGITFNRSEPNCKLSAIFLRSV